MLADDKVFWKNDRLTLMRHTDGVFELICDGVRVMPLGSFESIVSYLWAEFGVGPDLAPGL